MGVRALAKAMAVPPLSRGHASVRSQAELARARRSPAEAVPSSPHPLPPLRAPLGGRSRDDCAKRARLLLRKRSVRAEPLASEKMKLFPKNYTSWATFWSQKLGETCPSRRVCRAHTSNQCGPPSKMSLFLLKKISKKPGWVLWTSSDASPAGAPGAPRGGSALIHVSCECQ